MDLRCYIAVVSPCREVSGSVQVMDATHGAYVYAWRSEGHDRPRQWVGRWMRTGLYSPDEQGDQCATVSVGTKACDEVTQNVGLKRARSADG